MALFLFQKNSDDLVGALAGIAENQSAIDNNVDLNLSDFDVVTVTDELFNDVRLLQKEVTSKNGDTVNTRDLSVIFDYRADLTNYINKVVSELDKWLETNSSKPLASTITTYKNYITGLDVNSLVTDPSDSATFDQATKTLSDGTRFNSSLEKYVEDQGVTVVSTLQLL